MLKKYGNVEMEETLVKRLYDHLNLEYSEDSVAEDIKHDYLTENTGRDGNEYYWYMYGMSKCACIRKDTGEIIDDAERMGDLHSLDELFC